MWYKDKRVSSGEYRNTTVRKEHVQGGSKVFQESKTKDMGMSDVYDVRGYRQEHKLKKDTSNQGKSWLGSKLN